MYNTLLRYSKINKMGFLVMEEYLTCEVLNPVLRTYATVPLSGATKKKSKN